MLRVVGVTRGQYDAVEMKDALPDFACRVFSETLGGKRCAPDVLFLPDDRHARGHGRVAQRHHHVIGDGIDGALVHVEGVDRRDDRLR